MEKNYFDIDLPMHLNELRTRLLYALLAIVVGSQRSSLLIFYWIVGQSAVRSVSIQVTGVPPISR